MLLNCLMLLIKILFYHLLDPVKALSMEAKCLFKQDFIFNCPFIRERSEVGQIRKGLLNIVFMPEQHAESL